MNKTLLLVLALVLLALPAQAGSRAEIVITLDFHHQHLVELQLPSGLPVAEFEELLGQILGPVELVEQSYHLPGQPDVYTYRLLNPIAAGIAKKVSLDFSPLATYARSQGIQQVLLHMGLEQANNPFNYYIIPRGGQQEGKAIQVDLLAVPQLQADIGLRAATGWGWYLPLLALATWPFIWAGLVRARPKLAAGRLASVDMAVLVVSLVVAVLMGWLDIVEFYRGGSVGTLAYLYLGGLGALAAIVPCHALKIVAAHLAAGTRGIKTLPGHLAIFIGNMAAVGVAAAAVAAAQLLSGWQFALLYFVAALLIAILVALAQAGVAWMSNQAISHPSSHRFADRLRLASPRLLVFEESNSLLPGRAFCNRRNIGVQKEFWDSLGLEEQEFILGHEMGHMALDHPRWYVCERVLLLWSALLALTVHNWLGGSSWLSLALGGLVVFLTWSSTHRQRRQYEYQADAIAAWLSGNPAAGISSIQKAIAPGKPKKRIAGRLSNLKAMVETKQVLKPVLDVMPLFYRLFPLVYLVLPLPALALWLLLAPLHPLFAWLAMALLFAAVHRLNTRLQRSNLSLAPLDYAEAGKLAADLGVSKPVIFLFSPISGAPRAFYHRNRLYISRALWHHLSGEERRFVVAQLLAMARYRLNRWLFAGSQLYPYTLALAFTVHLWLPINPWLAAGVILALFYGANRLHQRQVSRLRRRADSAALKVTGNPIAALKALEKTLAGEGSRVSALLSRLQAISNAGDISASREE